METSMCRICLFEPLNLPKFFLLIYGSSTSQVIKSCPPASCHSRSSTPSKPPCRPCLSCSTQFSPSSLPPCKWLPSNLPVTHWGRTRTLFSCPSLLPSSPFFFSESCASITTALYCRRLANLNTKKLLR